MIAEKSLHHIFKKTDDPKDIGTIFEDLDSLNIDNPKKLVTVKDTEEEYEMNIAVLPNA